MSEPEPLPPGEGLSRQQSYKLITDTVAGPNLRKRDNLYQLAAIGIGLVAGAAIGPFTMRDKAAGAFLGGFIGLLVGLFGSGIFLMVYRALSHLTGRHD